MKTTSLVFAVSLAVMGCATPSRSPVAQAPTGLQEWQGRMSVSVQSNPPSTMSASFLLRGHAAQGELGLYSPLGTTLAALHWSPQRVQLLQGQTPEHFESLDQLTEKTTGAPLPIEAIFGWLQGRPLSAQGWQADLTDVSQGRLTAQRITPLPEVTLRIKLD